MHPSLPVLAVGALAGAALLVPSAASAETDSYWSTRHDLRAQSRVADPGNDISWTVLDHKIMLTTPDLLVVPFVYTCGTTADPADVTYNPAAFQTVYGEATGAAAYTSESDSNGLPVFDCDGTQHVSDVVLRGQQEVGFENGNIEVGLIRADLGSSPRPTFDHAVVGYDQLHDTRASVAVTVDATPESAKAGSTITVKGTVKRNGKAYKDKNATLFFQSRAGDPAVQVATDETDDKGKLSTKVTVAGPGTYFWTTASTDKTQAGAALGDYASAS